MGENQGVPMGSDLPPANGEAPSFLIAAQRDPGGARLQRLQVIKVWARSGRTGEHVYDVALSSNEPPSGAVIATGSIHDHEPGQSWGSEQLLASWSDPDFDPQAYAAYYVRVIEEPSWRYSYYDALALGWSEQEMTEIGAARHIPWSLQERAWSSPIWYTP